MSDQLDQLLAALELVAMEVAHVTRVGRSPFFRTAASAKVPEVSDYGLHVICSDTFAWACADSEAIRLEQAPEILRLYRTKGWVGVAEWVQEKRGGPGVEAFIAPVQNLVDEDKKVRSDLEALRAAVLAVGHEGGSSFVCGTFFRPPRPCNCKMRDLIKMVEEQP